MQLRRDAIIWLFLLLQNCHYSRSSSKTASQEPAVRISYGDTPTVQDYKFVAFATLHWCENIQGNNKCQETTVFTVTVLSHGYMLTSTQYIPCVVRYKLLVGDFTSDQYTFSDLRFVFKFGTKNVNKQPSQTINAKYPKEVDILLQTDALPLPAEARTTMFCPINYDIALLFVHTFIDFNEMVQPIPILKMPISNKIDHSCIALSFGKQEDNKFDGKLHFVKASFGDNTYCKQLDSREVPAHDKPYIVCSKGKERREVCGPDSGSPLVCVSDQKYCLVGIMSVTDDPNPLGDIYCGRTDTHYARYIYPGYFENWMSGVGIEFIDHQASQSHARARSVVARHPTSEEDNTTSSSTSKPSSSLGYIIQGLPCEVIAMLILTVRIHTYNDV